MSLRTSMLPLSVRHVDAAVRAKKSGWRSCLDDSAAASSSAPSIRSSGCPSVEGHHRAGGGSRWSGEPHSRRLGWLAGLPTDCCTSTSDDVFDLMVIERLEDSRFVEIAVLVDRVTHVARSPSARSSAANTSRSAAVRSSRPSLVRVTSSASGPSRPSNRSASPAAEEGSHTDGPAVVGRRRAAAGSGNPLSSLDVSLVAHGRLQALADQPAHRARRARSADDRRMRRCSIGRSGGATTGRRSW